MIGIFFLFSKMLHFVSRNSEVFTISFSTCYGTDVHVTDEIKETDIDCHGLLRGTSRATATSNMALNRLFRNLLKPSHSS